MEPQRPHRLTTQHPDLATHKDCGLYSLCCTLLYLAGHPLTILTPSKVHDLRKHLAHKLLSSTIFNINDILFRKRNRAPTSPTHNPQQKAAPDTHNIYNALSDAPPSASSRRATLRPRRSKPTSTNTSSLPDRPRSSVILSDPALEHTYISESTLPGAGKGLFAARDFDGNDEDSAFIGEYFGGEHLTAETVAADNHSSDYAIIKGGIVRDAWDPHSKRVICASGYVNDPLDEELENTQWDVHQKRLYITVKPGCKVQRNSELFGSYGDLHWCSTKFDFNILQKAVWRYRNQIDLSASGHWPHHPLAHALFNTPYNGSLPFDFTSCPCTTCIMTQTPSQPIASSSTPPSASNEAITKANLPNKRLRPPSPTTTNSAKRPHRDTPANRPPPTTSFPSHLPPRHTAPASKKTSVPKHSNHQRKTTANKRHMTSTNTLDTNATGTQLETDLATLALQHNITDLPTHIRKQLVSKNKCQSNREFSRRTYIDETDDPAGAGKGLFALTHFRAFDIIGIYSGGETLTLDEVLQPSYHSEYVVNIQGLIRDAKDPKTGAILCDTGRINDSLDRSRHNSDWYIHPDFPHLLLVIATKEVLPDAQFYIPYGGDYFCDARFPLSVLCAAIRCYNINIHTTSCWKALPQYPELSTHFPQPTTTTPRMPPPPSQRQPVTRPQRSGHVHTSEVTTFLRKITSSICPPDIHLKPDIVVALESGQRHHVIDTVINTLLHNTSIHALYFQGANLNNTQFNNLIAVIRTTHIYALNLGENTITIDNLQHLADTIPTTHLTQIYIEPQPFHPRYTQLLQLIRQCCELNRDKVQKTYAARNIIPAEWSHISTRGATLPGTLSSNLPNAEDTPSPLRHPPKTALDQESLHQVSTTPNPIPYNLSWNRHAQKLANAQSKIMKSSRKDSHKHQHKNKKSQCSATTSSGTTLRHWLEPTPSKKRSRSPESDAHGHLPRDHPSAGPRHSTHTSPESRPGRTKPTDIDIDMTLASHTCLSTAISPPALIYDNVHLACPTPETSHHSAASDIDRTNEISVNTPCVNIPHFNHDDHQSASSEPCPATVFNDLLFSSFCTAEPLTSNDTDNNNILDYDKRIADS